MNITEIIDRLYKGEIIAPDDPQAYRMLKAAYSTKKLLVQMNSSKDPRNQQFIEPK